MRNLRILGLALVLFLGVSCSAGDLPLSQNGGDTPPTVGGTTPPGNGVTVAPVDSSGGTPPDSSGGTPPDSSTGTPPDSSAAIDKTALLMCQVQEYAVTTAVIGPQGGQIQVGNHTLTIPQNALSAEVTITAEQVEGALSSVRFSPEGLLFAVPAELVLSYNNCANVQRSKRVVYTDETLKILELTPSLDITSNRQVRGLINHFSRYAVAY